MVAPSRISVVIPSYNYASFLPQSVASVFAQRGPDVDVQVIVVDDGSTDNTADVARGLGADITYIYQKNQGLSAARNTGLRAADGDFVAFLDADDLYTPDLLASQLRIFAEKPELDIVICRCLDVPDDGKSRDTKLWALVNSHWDVHACLANLAPVHCYMLRMQLARQIGFFDENMTSCEDQDYWLRCYGHGAKVGVNPRGMVLYRKHGENMTRNRQRMLSHDALMHIKIGNMLASTPGFPQDKCAGWLAHAAGSLNASGGLVDVNEELMVAMQEAFARGVFMAAAILGKETQTIDVQLHHIRQYYAARCLCLVQLPGLCQTPSAVRAGMALAKLFPRLAALSPEALEVRMGSTYAKLCVLSHPQAHRA